MLDRRRLIVGGTGLLSLAATGAPAKLFANSAAPLLAPRLLNVRDFGARGDSVTIDSPAIDRAIAGTSIERHKAFGVSAT